MHLRFDNISSSHALAFGDNSTMASWLRHPLSPATDSARKRDTYRADAVAQEVRVDAYRAMLKQHDHGGTAKAEAPVLVKCLERLWHSAGWGPPMNKYRMFPASHPLGHGPCHAVALDNLVAADGQAQVIGCHATTTQKLIGKRKSLAAMQQQHKNNPTQQRHTSMAPGMSPALPCHCRSLAGFGTIFNVRTSKSGAKSTQLC
jgi:hypothetical protein